jgi:hypothetical protein
MVEKLKSCPFCGGWYCKSMVRETRRDVVKDWNKRVEAKEKV